jgi:hypothetical protein
VLDNLIKNLYTIASPEQLRKFGQDMVAAADIKDEKQKQIDTAFKMITDGVNALKNI